MAGPDANSPLLVVGGNGVIGGALAAALRQRGDAVVATTRSSGNLPDHFLRLDLAADSWPALPACRAAVICAAVTRQDQCRQNPEAARHVNVVQTRKLIRQLITADAFVVFLSTNLVFDGSKPRCPAGEPYTPRIEYGRQKAEVERTLVRWPEHSAVVRLTKVFHPGLPLLQKWQTELSAGRAVNAFSDYRCSPIALSAVIAGIERIAAERRPGIWQFSGPADVSYADLALEVARGCGADPSLVKAGPVPPGVLEDNPPHTTLDASRAGDELGLVFPEAKRVLADCLGRAG